MKNKHFFFAAIAIVLASCGTGVSVTKRYHNRGFHIAWGGGKTDNSAPVRTPKKHTAPAAEAKTTESVATAEPAEIVEIPAFADATPVAETPVTTKSAVPATNPSMSAAAAANPKTVAPAKATWKEKLVQKAIVKKVAKKEKAGNYEGNQILAAIIAIFLPWLGVLVYEGTLTSHFWISLLLWLLLYVPGLIYALLVIFDVI